MSGTPLAVAQFTADASGFTAQFNQAVDATALNLYDTEAGTLGPADVTIVGTNQGLVRGSLVANNDQVTFVKSGGVLSPDVYTVTMRSASNGIKGADGSLLDGNNDGTSGDDYFHTFTVDLVPSAVFSVPDFARGPAQSINPGSGFPVSLSDGTNVTDVRFSLDYDPALLRIVEIHPGSGLPNGFQLEVDLTRSGVVSVHISSPPMAEGSVELIRLIAEVPADASYARSGVLDLNQVSINNGAIPSVGDDGVQVIAYFGDTTGNQRYSSLDGSRVLRVVAGLDSGFGPYPTIDPAVIADTTGNNILSSLDATRILQEVVGLDRTEIPDIVPVILVRLVDDNGANDSDLITANPTVSGTASDDGTITNFRVGLDGMLPADFVNVTAELQETRFVFTRERLEQILGAPLSDGIHTVHLEATDDAGIGPFFGGPATSSPVFDPSAPGPVFNPNAPSPVFNSGAPSPIFNPSAPGPAFDPSVPGPVVDESVSSNRSFVDLTFTLDTTAGAAPTTNSMLMFAGAGGVFQNPDADPDAGADTFSLSATEQGAITDAALEWNQQALEATRMTGTDALPAARVLAMVSLAQYDTPAAIDGTAAFLAISSSDGSDAFVEPQGGEVAPFALTSGDKFRLNAPPAQDSETYAQSLNEVQGLGSATSSNRTADQAEIAQFWADGQASYTPAGHWELLAQQIAVTAGNNLSSNVRSFAQLNGAMADAGIATRDAKFAFGLWRPIDIRQEALRSTVLKFLILARRVLFKQPTIGN